MSSRTELEKCWSCGEEVTFSNSTCPNCKAAKSGGPPPPLIPLPTAVERVTAFKRQSVWALIGLTIVTATIYWPFWLRRQSRILNAHLPDQPIPRWFFPVLLALGILSIGWAVPEALTDDAPAVMAIGKVLGRADLIFTIVWVFMIRNRLNVFLEASKRGQTWFNGLWTFLFGMFYLQHKLNRLQGQEQQDASMRQPGVGI